jgi:Ecdysteroid kinase-like family
MREQLAMAASVIGVTAASVQERIGGRKPVTCAHEVPATVDQLTPEWLTAVLAKGSPGARVTGFELGSGSDGTSSRRAITVDWNSEGQAAGLPSDIYSKSTPSLLNRLLVGVTGAAGAEALFYSRIRPTLDIGAPAGYHGGWDPRSCRSMVLTEDIAVARGAKFADATQLKVTRKSAESMIAELARYHGALWEDPRLADEWKLMRSDVWQRSFNARIGFDRGALVGMSMLPDLVPAQLMARKGEIRSGLMRSLDHNAGGPLTLLHQDVHPNNWFTLPDGSLHLYDWQGIGRGGWALDVSYALSTSLDIEDRRDWERDLIALYVDELALAGGRPPSVEEAFLAYRQQMFRGFIYWTYTYVIGRMSKLQTDAHVRTVVERAGQAMMDLESLDSLGRAPRW